MAGIAILGAGIFAKEKHLPAIVTNKVNLKAVYSRSQATAETLLTDAKELGLADIELYSEETEGHKLDDLLKREDIHAVIIVLPILVQPHIIRRCLAAGKHVLSEKPIAKDVATARLLIEEYKTRYAPKGLILGIAENVRFQKEFELARKWVVEDKAIGEITQVHLQSWRNQPPSGKYYETPWRKVPEYQGGFLLDGGVHQTAMVRFITGQDVIETHGFACQVAEHLPPLDTVNSGILMSGGATGTISMSFAATVRAQTFTIMGTKGSVVLTGNPDGNTVLTQQLLSGEKKTETLKSDGVELEIKAFMEATQSGVFLPRAGPEEALNDLAIIESLCSPGGKVDNY